MSDLHLLSPTRVPRRRRRRRTSRRAARPDVGLLVADRPAAAAARVHDQPGRRRPGGRRPASTSPWASCAASSSTPATPTPAPASGGWPTPRRMCELAAAAFGCDASEVLPVVDRHHRPPAADGEGRRPASPHAAAALGEHCRPRAAFMDAILTTDLKRKAAASTVKVGRRTVTVAGVCKGSGMIGPRMAVAGKTTRVKAKHATMLAYLTTDAAGPAAVLRTLLGRSADGSFNAVTVDDHASTNDTACPARQRFRPASGSTRRPRSTSSPPRSTRCAGRSPTRSPPTARGRRRS